MMKKLVRKSVFETNSSSAHSIVMASEDNEFVLDTIYPDQFGKVYVRGGEFGWEWEKYNDAQTKLDYAYEDNIDIELLRKVVMDQTGATEVVFVERNGYIDHDSVGTARSVCVDEESTRNFIFNKNSWLFTANDNTEADPTFYDVPVYGEGKVTTPVYKYELSIEGFDKKTYFKEKPEDKELSTGINALLEGVLMTENGLFITNQTIEFQITRDRNFFEKSWQLEQDYSKGHILMIKEGSHYHNAENLLKERGVLEGLNYWERSKLITKKLEEHPSILKKLPFTLKEI